MFSRVSLLCKRDKLNRSNRELKKGPLCNHSSCRFSDSFELKWKFMSSGLLQDFINSLRVAVEAIVVCKVNFRIPNTV